MEVDCIFALIESTRRAKVIRIALCRNAHWNTDFNRVLWGPNNAPGWESMDGATRRRITPALQPA
jgi:hypothetical protein